jgi:hypothetical protein
MFQSLLGGHRTRRAGSWPNASHRHCLPWNFKQVTTPLGTYWQRQPRFGHSILIGTSEHPYRPLLNFLYAQIRYVHTYDVPKWPRAPGRWSWSNLGPSCESTYLAFFLLRYSLPSDPSMLGGGKGSRQNHQLWAWGATLTQPRGFEEPSNGCLKPSSKTLPQRQEQLPRGFLI